MRIPFLTPTPSIAPQADVDPVAQVVAELADLRARTEPLAQRHGELTTSIADLSAAIAQQLDDRTRQTLSGEETTEASGALSALRDERSAAEDAAHALSLQITELENAQADATARHARLVHESAYRAALDRAVLAREASATVLQEFAELFRAVSAELYQADEAGRRIAQAMGRSWNFDRFHTPAHANVAQGALEFCEQIRHTQTTKIAS